MPSQYLCKLKINPMMRLQIHAFILELSVATNSFSNQKFYSIPRIQVKIWIAIQQYILSYNTVYKLEDSLAKFNFLLGESYE